MKLPLLALLVVCFLCLGVTAQQKMTDKDLEGLKGPVRSVIEEFKIVRGPNPDGKKENIRVSKTYFNKDGQTERIVYLKDDTELTFSIIDDFKTFKTTKKPDVDENSKFRVSFPDQLPIEPNEKLTKPDSRYELRYVYEYDEKGRVISEREFTNTGKLTQLESFTYDEDGHLIKLRSETTGAIETNTYTYDEEGMVVEQKKDRKIKVAGKDSNDRTVYSDYKTDEKETGSSEGG